MVKTRFKPINTKRRSVIVEEAIKSLILSGGFEVGSKLSAEKDMCKQFGVSIVTLREALRGLEGLGMIRKKRGKNGGIFITKTDRHIVRNATEMFFKGENPSASSLNEVRRIIEPPCVRIAASKMSQAELAAIEKNVKYCEDKIEKSKPNFFDIEEKNIEFHRLLAEATHNPFLALAVDYVVSFLSNFRTKTDIKLSIDATKAHRRIFNALKEGQTQIAKQELIAHISAVGENLVLRVKSK